MFSGEKCREMRGSPVRGTVANCSVVLGKTNISSHYRPDGAGDRFTDPTFLLGIQGLA